MEIVIILDDLFEDMEELDLFLDEVVNIIFDMIEIGCYVIIRN